MNITWSPGMTLESIERKIIERALIHYAGNKTAMAQALGISVRTVDNKLEEYGAEDRLRKARHDARIEREKIHLARARGMAPSPANDASIPKAVQGIHSEPAARTTEEYAVPVPEPEEVQELLPARAAAGGKRRRR